MTNNSKEFDCVEMMHQGALRIHEETKGMSMEEELAYWERKNQEIRRKYPMMREAREEYGNTE